MHTQFMVTPRTPPTYGVYSIPKLMVVLSAPPVYDVSQCTQVMVVLSIPQLMVVLIVPPTSTSTQSEFSEWRKKEGRGWREKLKDIPEVGKGQSEMAKYSGA